MIGHGISHVTFAGVALGLLLNLMPLLTALIVAVLTGLIIMFLRERSGLYSDTTIAIFSSLGFALGILLVSLSKNFNVDLFSYLFGEILAIEAFEVWLSVALAVSVVGIVIINYHRFMYLTFDRESAKVSGIGVNQLDILFTVLTAVTVVLGMKIVGILLVSSLLVIPAAAGLQLAVSFRQAIFISALVALISVVAGLFLSFHFDLPASGTIVILSFIFFLVAFSVKKKRS